MKFPEFAEDDALADWIGDLAELGGYFAGIISSKLSGSSTDKIQTEKLKRFRMRLENINVEEEDIKIKNYCSEYLKTIEEMVEEAIISERPKGWKRT